MLEIIANKLSDIVEIDNSDADRIEFIRHGQVGGLTPTHKDMMMARQMTDKPIFVMIRPSHISFVYSPHEKQEMLDSIEVAKMANLDGIVIGALTPDGRIDLEFMNDVIEAARPMKITFHRAFEELVDLERSAKTIANLGIDFILTSGACKNPVEGIPTLSKLKKSLSNTKTEILVGGGVNQDNINLLRRELDIDNIHIGSFARIERDYEKPIDIEVINKLASKKE